MSYYVNLGFLFASAVISAALAAYIWRYRRAVGVVAAIGMMLCVTLLACGYIYEELSPGLSTKLASTYISYIGIAWVPVMFFMFALRYTGSSSFFTRRNIILLNMPILLSPNSLIM
jgi:hypothetical protein